MTEIIKKWVHFISNRFPSIFLKYLRNQLKTSELTKDSLYKITKVAHTATNLEELYKSIHENINKLMYADNFYIAIYDKNNKKLSFPYMRDQFDNDEGLEINYDGKSLTGYCIQLGQPLLFTHKEIIALKKKGKVKPIGTIPEWYLWMGVPLKIGTKTLGAIVVQSYDREKILTIQDRDLLNFVSELVAMVIERKHLESQQLEYQLNLEKKIKERTKELFFAKEKAESATHAKSGFLANMSHELRTPLNAIIGFCEILIEDTNETQQEGMESDLKKIHKSGIDLLALINDILDLSKIEVNKVDINISKFELKDLVNNVHTTLEPYAKLNNNKIVINIPNSQIFIESDELKIRQILFNLLTNACKVSNNSKVILTVNQETLSKSQFIVFKVQDFGTGIAKDKLKNIFEPFNQGNVFDNSKIKGTGLGLAIAKTYSELLGGYIHVESEEGEGSIFTSYILQNYISYDIVSDKKADDQSQNYEFPEKGKVLVIDDDIHFLDLINRRLTKEGYLVFTANSGEQGLYKAKKLIPDIIILDIIMPDIDGWIVYQKIKKIPLLSQIPIIIVTIGDYKKMAKDFGVVDFLSKPVSWGKLNIMLEKYTIISKSKHILVIDDDASTRIILRKMLVKDGWRVDEAENGVIAIERMEQEKPELILLDLLMPVMDGFNFLKKIKKNLKWKNIPIIIITSKDLTADDYSFLSPNVDKIIQKGKYTRKEIINQIDASIKESNLYARFKERY